MTRVVAMRLSTSVDNVVHESRNVDNCKLLIMLRNNPIRPKVAILPVNKCKFAC